MDAKARNNVGNLNYHLKNHAYRNAGRDELYRIFAKKTDDQSRGYPQILRKSSRAQRY